MWIKKLRKRKLQSILIILIVMVCSMLMASSIVIMTSWEKPYNDLSKECNSPILKLYLFDKTMENGLKIKEKFEQLEEVSTAEVIEYSYVRDKVYVNNKETETFLDLVTYNNKLHENIRMISGDKSNLQENECLIPAVYANDNNIHIGDRILIKDNISFVVKGIYTDPYNMSVSFDVEMILKEIPKELESTCYLSVYTDQNISGSELIDIYRENNNTVLEGRGVTIENRISNNQMTEQVLGGILLAMSFIILLVSGIMIRYMVKNTMLSEKRTIAIYKTIGLENRNIIGIYLQFYLFLVFIGSLTGVYLSKIISNSFTKHTFRNLGVTGSSDMILAGLLCMLIILSFVSLQVYFVINKTKRLKPIDVFRGEENKNGNPTKGKFTILSFSPLAMAERMLVREKKNTIIIVITCIMTAYCVNFAATSMTLIKGMQKNNYYWIGFDKHDVSMESTDLSQFNKAIEDLRDLEEVQMVIPTSTDTPVSIEWKKGIGDSILSSMIYESYQDIEMPVINGRNPLYSNEIAISNSIAEKLNKHVGDYINIYFNGNKKVTLLISGTFQSFYDMGKSCRLLGSTLTENQISFQYSEGSIYLKEGIRVDEFIQKYSENYADSVKFIDRSDKYGNIMNMITGPQMSAIKPFMLLALILGGLNIVAIVYLKNKDHSKVYSIYKAIGYSANHLLKANLWYILFIGLVSIVVTVPIFIFIFPKIMILAMSFMGFQEYPVTYNFFILVISNLSSLAVFVISGLLSSKTLYQNPIEDLTCE